MEQFVDHVRDIEEQNIELKKEIERVMEMGLTSQK
jgi:cell division septum initiation protein DivIVA